MRSQSAISEGLSSTVQSNTVTVAVIIPAFNAEQYLDMAISSVLKQTLSDLQLVIVDDGSTDSTLKIARSIQDSRVRVISIPNSGPARARNAGVQAARPSRFVAFLDADDTWDPAKLEEQVRFLDERPDLAAAGCFMRYVAADGRMLGETGQALTLSALRRVTRGELFPFQMSSLLVRTSVFKAVGGFDEVFRHQGSEDLDLYMRIAQAAEMDCVPRQLGSYRIHRDSTMSRFQAQAIQAARFVIARAALRAQGKDLGWEDFVATDRRTLLARQKDLRTTLYRTSALWYAERKHLRALSYLAMAFAVAPFYTSKRLLRQKFGR